MNPPESDRGRLVSVGLIVGVVVLAVLVGAAIASFFTLHADFEDANDDRAVLAGDVEVLRGQLSDLDVEPDVGPPGGPGEAGERGERGQSGPAGRDGRDGDDGEAGRDGIDGRDGDPGPPGQTGAQGEPGSTGPQGEPGIQGPAGEPGPAGGPGPQGETGPSGSSGAEGPPPESFSFEFANRTWHCSDTDADGHYECTDDDPIPPEEP